MRLNAQTDTTVPVYTADVEDFIEEDNETLLPPGMRLVAGFDYNMLDWESLVHLLERINGNVGENRFGIVDQQYSESIFVVQVTASTQQEEHEKPEGPEFPTYVGWDNKEHAEF